MAPDAAMNLLGLRGIRNLGEIYEWREPRAVWTKQCAFPSCPETECCSVPASVASRAVVHGAGSAVGRTPRRECNQHRRHSRERWRPRLAVRSLCCSADGLRREGKRRLSLFHRPGKCRRPQPMDDWFTGNDYGRPIATEFARHRPVPPFRLSQLRTLNICCWVAAEHIGQRVRPNDWTNPQCRHSTRLRPRTSRPALSVPPQKSGPSCRISLTTEERPFANAATLRGRPPHSSALARRCTGWCLASFFLGLATDSVVIQNEDGFANAGVTKNLPGCEDRFPSRSPQ